MTTKTYIYRGVKFLKDGDQRVTLNHNRLEKVYRGNKYLKLPKWEHIVGDHVYRGAHYMA
jgi:hypothetical protein